jgi:hypothetical protein
MSTSPQNGVSVDEFDESKLARGIAHGLPEPTIFDGYLPENCKAGLTAAEARSFKENGFLVKTCLLDRDDVDATRDRVFAVAPESIDLANPGPWVDAP